MGDSLSKVIINFMNMQSLNNKIKGVSVGILICLDHSVVEAVKMQTSAELSADITMEATTEFDPSPYVVAYHTNNCNNYHDDDYIMSEITEDTADWGHWSYDHSYQKKINSIKVVDRSRRNWKVVINGKDEYDFAKRRSGKIRNVDSENVCLTYSGS